MLVINSHEKWIESGQAVAAVAWVFGAMASKNEYELAERAKTSSKRAEHIQKATTLGLASDVGAGFLVLNSFKRHPKSTTAVVVLYFGLSAYISSASLPNRLPFLQGLLSSGVER